MKQTDIKNIVKEKYSRIAEQSDKNQKQGCCVKTSCCSELDYTVFSESYDSQDGYMPDADLGLGCGIPTDFANIKEGDAVPDLGSGAGNDCFVARAIVGENGRVVGLDFAEPMIDKAVVNAQKLGYSNVEFVKGDIDQMPLVDNQFDVVISNCVLNLVPDKKSAFDEILRVLKHGGHFCVSDVVIRGELPEKIKNAAEMYAGCVSGAIQIEDYLNIIKQSGFQNIEVHKQRIIEIPDDILKLYFDDTELQNFHASETGLYSITVSAEKNKH